MIMRETPSLAKWDLCLFSPYKTPSLCYLPEGQRSAQWVLSPILLCTHLSCGVKMMPKRAESGPSNLLTEKPVRATTGLETSAFLTSRCCHGPVTTEVNFPPSLFYVSYYCVNPTFSPSL